MDFKAVRQEMTEQALLIEEALKRSPRISLVELADVCDLSPAQAGFIMEQMRILMNFHIVNLVIIQVHHFPH